jgi:hypothetical protein
MSTEIKKGLENIRQINENPTVFFQTMIERIMSGKEDADNLVEELRNCLSSKDAHNFRGEIWSILKKTFKYDPFNTDLPYNYSISEYGEFWSLMATCKCCESSEEFSGDQLIERGLDPKWTIQEANKYLARLLRLVDFDDNSIRFVMFNCEPEKLIS